MVSINYASREVTCKIVFYGPGLSGKTTNLIYVHNKVPSTTRGKMISLATEADRTLYFDFLPINIGTINGFTAKFQLYTVPGQVYYNATRKLVLRGVDGIVFVADSQAEKMDENIESLTNMKENLAEYGYDINDIPVVIQYNKRDLPGVLTVPELEAKLNPLGWMSFEAEAVTGKGVFDTLKMIIKLVLEKAKSTRSATSPTAAKQPEPAATPAAVAGAASFEPPGKSGDYERTSAGAAPAPEPAMVSRQTAYNVPDDVNGETDEENHNGNGVEFNTLKEERVLSRSALDQDVSQPPDAVDVASRDAGNTPAAEEPAGRRPYPGSTTSKILRRDRRITVSDFQPATKDVEPVGGGRMAGAEPYHDAGAGASLPSPYMAPPKRIVKKKQGFFKRLFGIK